MDSENGVSLYSMLLSNHSMKYDQIPRIALLAGFLLLALTSIGCSTPDPTPPPAAPRIEGYVVGAPDMLLVNILPDPVLSSQVRVRMDGMISIDLIGDVLAAGRTPYEISQVIEQEIGRFKRDASVNVSVISSPSQFVTIFGEVARPGTFALVTETRISEAIGQVGGTRPFASLNNVRVIRTDGGQTQVIEVRLGDIQRGDLSTNLVIREGDLIVVPATLLARIGYVVQMVFFPFQPVVSTLGSIGGAATGVQAF